MPENLDVKSEVGTSPASPSPSPSTQDAQVSSVDDAIAAAIKSSASPAEPAKVEEATQVEPTTEPEQKPEEKPTEAKVEPTKEGEPKPDDKGPIPYERFAEVNQQKVEFEQRIQQIEPLAQAQQSVVDHCQRNNIAPEEFAYWMNVAALSKSDPIKALELLKPSLAQWQLAVGEVLPPDLQKAVDSGELSQQYAKELASVRGKQQITQQQIQQAQQQAQQAQLATQQREFVNSITTWENSKKVSDPEFVPAKKGSPDGKYEMFVHRFTSDCRNANVRTSADLLAIAEQSYAAVNSSLSRFIPRPLNGKPALRSSQSTNAPLAPPKTVEEAVSRAAAKHGIAFTPR